MSKKLLEGVNGAEYLGTGNGFDVFDIKTYQAAQSFVLRHSDIPAGAIYTQSEQIFNANITEACKLYYFVYADSNQVYAGAVKSFNTTNDITIQKDTVQFRCKVNFQLEIRNSDGNEIKFVKEPFPFYLIPGASIIPKAFVNQTPYKCIVVDDRNVIVAMLPQFYDMSQSLEFKNLPQSIQEISKDAFKFGLVPESLNYENGDPLALPGQVSVADLRYQVEGDHIVILGVRNSGRSKDLIIPAELEPPKRLSANNSTDSQTAVDTKKRPVTKIASYAFYNKTFNSVQLPKTIKLIEQGAFLGTKITQKPYYGSAIRVQSDCIIGKDNDRSLFDIEY